MTEYKPFIIVKLDKERNFRLSNKALFIYEEQFGKKLSDLDFEDLSMREFNEIIYVGLKSSDDELTLEETIDLIDLHGNLEELMTIIGEAVESSRFLSLKPETRKKALALQEQKRKNKKK